MTRLNQMGRKFVLVTDDQTLEAPYRFLTPASENGLFMAMCGHAVPALIAGYLAAMREEPYSRGFKGIWAEGEGVYNTVNSEKVCVD